MPKGLTKTLIKDMSCDPNNLVATSFMQICERVDFWDDKVNEIGASTPLGQAIQDAASSIIKQQPPDGFHLDLQMIEAVGQRLEAQPSAVKSDFAGFVTKVADHYGKVMEMLPAIGNNEITQKAKEISAGMRTVAHDVETWARGVNVVAGTIAKLPFPKPITDFLQDIGTVSTDVQDVAAHIGGVINSLWQKTTNAVKQADDLSDKAKILRNSLTTAIGDQKVKIETELKAIETQITRQAPALENALGGIKAGFQAAGIIAGLFGKPQLANDIVAVGEAAITIAGSVATLIAGSAMGGPAMPVIAIAGAVAMLASHFLGGSAQREDIILKSIDKLSKHMDERFDRIEFMIQKSVEYLAEHIDRRFMDLGNHMDKRFDRIEDTLNYMYKEMLDQFAKLHTHSAGHFSVIQQKLDGLRQAIDYLHTDMAQSMVALYEQSYVDHKNKALTNIARNQISPNKHRSHYGAITTWTKEKVKSDTMAGNDVSSDLADRVHASGMNQYINKIRMKAVALGVTDLGRLVNPAAWADGVRTLIAYFAMTPKLYEYITPNNEILNDIREIKDEGARVQNFIRSMQKNETLFNDLIKQYRTALLQVMQKAYDLTIVSDTANPIGTASSSPERALMRVTAIEVCDSFITREVYPAGLGIPDLERLDSITHHNQQTYDVPRFLSDILGEISRGLQRTNPSFPNGWHHKAFYEEMIHGKSSHHDGACCQDGELNNIKFYILDPLVNNYNSACAEATSLRTASEDLRNFIRDSHLNQLATDATYRANRISAILSHHAVQEKDRAATAGELPHYGLMRKYFSIKNQQNLNAVLSADPNFGLLLDNLQKAYEELSILIGFSFPKQFAGDPNLRVFLDRLWDKQDILDYIAANANKPEFIGAVLQNTLEPQGELEAFRQFILTFVADAKLAIDSEQYDHPLIKKVLHELQEFEKVVNLAVKKPAACLKVSRVYHSLGSYDDETKSNQMFYALAKQISRATSLPCNPLELERKVQQANGDEEAILELLAKSENIEIIVIEDLTGKPIHIKACNLGAKHTVHLLHADEQAWYSFNPSDDCKKRSDYLAARLMTTASSASADSEIIELKQQIESLTQLLQSLAVNQNKPTAAAAVAVTEEAQTVYSRTDLVKRFGFMQNPSGDIEKAKQESLQSLPGVEQANRVVTEQINQERLEQGIQNSLQDVLQPKAAMI